MQIFQKTPGSASPRHDVKSMVSGIAIFFGGDRVEMYGLDEDINALQDPSTQARIIASRFPSDWTTVVVSPSRTEAGSACYDHFFEKLTLTGEPLGYGVGTFKASAQICSLLMEANLLTQCRSEGVDGSSIETWSDPSSTFPPCVVLGFSKGAVVLNQVLAEYAGFQKYLSMTEGESTTLRGTRKFSGPSEEVVQFFKALQEVHYLDAGLNCRGAHLTDPETMKAIGMAFKKPCSDLHVKKKDSPSQGLKIVLHGTPRQWVDSRRPFILQERDRFVHLCEENGIPVLMKSYFEGQTSSLRMHFEILNAWERK